MATVSDDLRQFHGYLTDQLVHRGEVLTPEEVLDQWREHHPSPPELADSGDEIQAALDEMCDGESGQPAREFVAEVRRTLGLATRP